MILQCLMLLFLNNVLINNHESLFFFKATSNNINRKITAIYLNNIMDLGIFFYYLCCYANITLLCCYFGDISR